MLDISALPRFANGHMPSPVLMVDPGGDAWQGVRGALIDVTPVVDTAIYADGDVLFATTAIANAVPVDAGLARLDSVAVLDEIDLGVALDLVFLRSKVALGVLNAAPNISDVNALEILTTVRLVTGDYIDFGGARMAAIGNLNRMVKAAAASRSLYVAGITRGGTPTYTSASGIKLRLGFRW